MKRRELERAIRAASQVSEESEFLLIGSQAVHASTQRPPAEVLLSQECDLYPRNRPETADRLHAELGRGSPFARRHGFYVDVVDPEVATLPSGWQRRLKPLLIGKIKVLCLDLPDLAVSKLAAGRLKDLEFSSWLLVARRAPLAVAVPAIIASTRSPRFRFTALKSRAPRSIWQESGTPRYLPQLLFADFRSRNRIEERVRLLRDPSPA